MTRIAIDTLQEHPHAERARAVRLEAFDHASSTARRHAQRIGRGRRLAVAWVRGEMLRQPYGISARLAADDARGRSLHQGTNWKEPHGRKLGDPVAPASHILSIFTARAT